MTDNDSALFQFSALLMSSNSAMIDQTETLRPAAQSPQKVSHQTFQKNSPIEWSFSKNFWLVLSC